MSELHDLNQVDRVLDAHGPGSLVHLVGAGGCGMSGLGHLLLDLGYRVAGSDLVANEEVEQLQARGAAIAKGHSTSLDGSACLLIYTSALQPDNPELRAADQLNIPRVRRGVFLAALARRQCSICVAGMHGKTTTSALLAYALEQLQAHPSYAIGALVPQLVPHARFSKGNLRSIQANQPYFVLEADESDGTLASFKPEFAIVLNVDADHLDHFPDIDAVMAEFQRFAEQTQRTIMFCADDARLAEAFARIPRAISYGTHPLAAYRSEFKSASIDPGTASPKAAFAVWHKGTLLGEFRISLLGLQNVSNATAAIALLHQLGFLPEDIARAIAGFQGAARRQQELFRDGQIRVFEDYGHHPNEIRATLRALRGLGGRRLLVVFQPHRFTRTQHLWREFAACFDGADVLWLGELYPANEPEIPGINSGFLANAIRAQGQAVRAVLPLKELPSAVRAELQPGDLVVFLGAGDITLAAHELANTLLARSKEVPCTGSEKRSVNSSRSAPHALLSALAARVGKDSIVRHDEPLARRTTLRVGGNADLYCEPANEEDLAAALRFCSEQKVSFVILGRGSNLLIRDGGIRGLVLCLTNPRFTQIRVSGEELDCGAGARLKQIAVEARRQSLSGLEFLEGIPGSLGGAMRMNAGAMGSWLFDVVETIRFMDFSGLLHERRASEVNVEYRGCPLFKNHIALGAVLHGRLAPNESIRARMEVFSRKRWESQPSQPSAGCIFKNPSAIPAGRLLDELGLKGTRVGGAVVSDVHANFIVNDGTATARDVLNLIEVIKERAKTARGITLETEVEILGEG